MTKSRLSGLTTALLALTAVACSDGASRRSPLGPSPVAAAPPQTAGSLEGWAAANGWSAMADGRVAVADGLVVEGTDVIGSVTGNCPSRSITVRGVPVAVTPSTAFSAPLSCVSLEPGMPVNVTAVLVQTSSGFSVTAINLSSPQGASVKAPTPNRRGERVGGEGIVGAIRGSCPSLTMVISGYTVQTTDATEFKTACEAMRQGAKVALEVEKQDDGSMVVLWIELRN
jgi:hypothetical protein